MRLGFEGGNTSGFLRPRGRVRRRPISRSIGAFAVLFGLTATALGVVLPGGGSAAPVVRSTSATELTDNFTKDAVLNTSLWRVNGTAAYAYSQANCGGSCPSVVLQPTFSTAGMEIANISHSSTTGIIQSVENFAPPFTITAVVMATVSNGHPVVFGIGNAIATYGGTIWENADPKDCSAESNCSNPSLCGVSTNPGIPSGQCYYGVFTRVGLGNNTSWGDKGRLYASPSLDLVYTLVISVSSSDNGYAAISQGGKLLGSTSGSLGSAGPFYIDFGQAEGAPVPGPGPNQAYWYSINVTNVATTPPPGSSGSGSAPFPVWIVLVAIVALLVIVLAATARRGGFTVTVIDFGTQNRLTGAGVTAMGPKELSGMTGRNGSVTFTGTKTGDYNVTASASGYLTSVPAVVRVKGRTRHTIRLNRTSAPAAPAPAPAMPPTPAVRLSAPPVPPSPAAAAPAAPVPPAATTPVEGVGGPRMRQIIANFQSKGALSPETALTAEELGLSRMFVRIMRRRRGKTMIFIEVNGRYYLDQKALRDVHDMKELMDE